MGAITSRPHAAAAAGVPLKYPVGNNEVSISSKVWEMGNEGQCSEHVCNMYKHKVQRTQIKRCSGKEEKKIGEAGSGYWDSQKSLLILSCPKYGAPTGMVPNSPPGAVLLTLGTTNVPPFPDC